jgi:SAM-dependent methyltransferase
VTTTTEQEKAIATLHQVYARDEPAGTDTWSPLHDDIEMWHRARLLVEACQCLRLIPNPIENLQVLDVGCGVGRSSRLLVDLGISPQNLLAIDFRESAIVDARQRNPAIRFRHIADLSQWPRESFDLIVQCTAFSSLPGQEIRKQTASLMETSIGDGGYIFWWDLLLANTFAGGERLDPASLFPRFQHIRERQVSIYPELSESLRRLRRIGNWIRSAGTPLTHRPTHLVALMQKAEVGAMGECGLGALGGDMAYGV